MLQLTGEMKGVEKIDNSQCFFGFWECQILLRAQSEYIEQNQNSDYIRQTANVYGLTCDKTGVSDRAVASITSCVLEGTSLVDN